MLSGERSIDRACSAARRRNRMFSATLRPASASRTSRMTANGTTAYFALMRIGLVGWTLFDRLYVWALGFAWKSRAACTTPGFPIGANVAPGMNESTSHLPCSGWRYTLNRIWPNLPWYLAVGARISSTESSSFVRYWIVHPWKCRPAAGYG